MTDVISAVTATPHDDSNLKQQYIVHKKQETGGSEIGKEMENS